MHFGLVDIGQRWLEGKTRAKMGKNVEFKSPVFIVLLCDYSIFLQFHSRMFWAKALTLLWASGNY